MTLAELRGQVSAQRTVIDSAVLLLKSLHERLAAAIADDDPAAVQALADELKANTDSLASAVQENTPTPPAEPAPPATPTP